MSALTRFRVRAVITASEQRRYALTFTFLLALLVAGALPTIAQQKSSASEGAAPAAASAAVQSDTLHKAKRQEPDRSKHQHQMDNVPAPYYIEYRLSDVE